MPSNLSPEEIEGGYRRLCASLLVSSAYAMAENTRGIQPDKRRAVAPFLRQVRKQREVAREWVNGGIGALTFEECCDAIDVQPDRMRADLQKHCPPGSARAWRTKLGRRGPQRR
jgi:hypothetical protein